MLELKLAAAEGSKESKGTISGDDLNMVFGRPNTPGEARLLRNLKRLLNLPSDLHEAKIVYGSATTKPDEIPIVTRSILGILAAVAYDIEVPEADVENGFTLPSITRTQDGRKPEILIRSSLERPASSYAAVPYRGRWFSIADNDMDSKIAFAVLQLLISLAQTPQASGAIVTVPAR